MIDYKLGSGSLKQSVAFMVSYKLKSPEVDEYILSELYSPDCDEHSPISIAHFLSDSIEDMCDLVEEIYSNRIIM